MFDRRFFRQKRVFFLMCGIISNIGTIIKVVENCQKVSKLRITLDFYIGS